MGNFILVFSIGRRDILFSMPIAHELSSMNIKFILYNTANGMSIRKFFKYILKYFLVFATIKAQKTTPFDLQIVVCYGNSQ